MNNEFLELIRLLGDAGYQVRSIHKEKSEPAGSFKARASRNKDTGDIVLRISPATQEASDVESPPNGWLVNRLQKDLKEVLAAMASMAIPPKSSSLQNQQARHNS